MATVISSLFPPPFFDVGFFPVAGAVFRAAGCDGRTGGSAMVSFGPPFLAGVVLLRAVSAVFVARYKKGQHHDGADGDCEGGRDGVLENSDPRGCLFK
jgi:hypothetical protein